MNCVLCDVQGETEENVSVWSINTTAHPGQGTVMDEIKACFALRINDQCRGIRIAPENYGSPSCGGHVA